MTHLKKLIPLLALFMILAGCTGSCVGRPAVSATPPGTATPPPQATPAQTPPTVTPSPSAMPEETEAPPVPSETPLPPVAETPTPAVTSTPALPPHPEDAEVLETYQQAEEVFSWFQLETLPVDANSTLEVDGLTYSRVEYPGVSSMADLRGVLKRFFSDELVTNLLPPSDTQYRDVDGVLYVQPSARTPDPTKGGELRQVIWQSDTLCQVQVTVELVDAADSLVVLGSETHVFPYQKVGADWIFTDFYLVR